MRIVALKAENIKRLKAVELKPNKFINRISGANESGKTSLLDGIEWALTGTSTVPSAPVRKGSGRAVIQLDLGEVIVTRKFVEGGSRNGVLTIEAKDTHNLFRGPQEMLDELMGKVSFDPLEFLRMHPKKQFEVLKGLVELDIDLEQLEADYEADYLLRRDVKKEITALETRRDAIHVPEGLPAQKRDETALVTELTEAAEFNEKIAEQQRERDRIAEERKTIKLRADERANHLDNLRKEIQLLEKGLRDDIERISEVDDLIDSWKPLPERKNAADLQQQINEARTVNAAIDRANQRKAFEKEISEKEGQVEKLSAALDRRNEEKAKAIENAHFPVDGLAFGEDEVIYDSFPFNQASNAQQIRASVAIGMALNPKLRVMRIKDGSLLDDNSLKIVAEMAQEKDFQIFIEQVSTDGKVGVYLEEGEVKAVNEEPLDKPMEPKKTAPAKKPTKKPTKKGA
jgi:AAA domain